jgi:hypothetical protein
MGRERLETIVSRIGNRMWLNVIQCDSVLHFISVCVVQKQIYITTTKMEDRGVKFRAITNLILVICLHSCGIIQIYRLWMCIQLIFNRHSIDNWKSEVKLNNHVAVAQ